jgi:hypothetical protein
VGLTVVPGNVLSTVEVNLIPNLYETSMTRAYLIREGRVSSPISYENVVELFQERISTLRFKLIKRDYDGNEEPFDLTGFTVMIYLKTRAGYDSDIPDTPDSEWTLTKESPNTLGLCYIELDTSDIPDEEGSYTAEIVLISGSDEHSFSRFGVTVTKV